MQSCKEMFLELVCAGIDPNEKRPPQELLLEWIGEVLQS